MLLCFLTLNWSTISNIVDIPYTWFHYNICVYSASLLRTVFIFLQDHGTKNYKHDNSSREAQMSSVEVKKTKDSYQKLLRLGPWPRTTSIMSNIFFRFEAWVLGFLSLVKVFFSGPIVGQVFPSLGTAPARLSSHFSWFLEKYSLTASKRAWCIKSDTLFTK